jgi:D-galactarolactone cycloisomerase
VDAAAPVEVWARFESDGSTDNPLRAVACLASYELAADGTVSPLAGPGLGVDVDEDFIRAHPVTEGPAWPQSWC